MLSQSTSMKYWKEKLDGLTPFSLRANMAQPSSDTGDIKNLTFKLNPVIFDQLHFIHNTHNNNNNTMSDDNKNLPPRWQSVILTSLYTLLYRYTGLDNYCVNTSLRINNDSSAKTFALRLPISGNMNFLDLVDKVESALNDSYQHYLPLEDINEIVSSQNTDVSAFNDIICDFDLYSLKKTKLKDINYFGIYFEKNNSRRFCISYNSTILSTAFAKNIAAHLSTLWASIVQNPKQSISEISLLSREEKNFLANANPTEQRPPHPRLTGDFVHDMFKHNANLMESQDKTAVVFHNKNCVCTPKKTTCDKISYSELDRKSDVLADYLKNQGVQAEVRVGVCISRSITLIIGILAVLKAEGVVVPLGIEIENNILASNIIDKVQETGLKLVLTDDITKPLFSFKAKNNVDALDAVNINNEKYYANHQIKSLITFTSTFNRRTFSQKSLAYIIFTSGTTGKPKGVMIAHEGLTNLAHALADRNLKPNSNVLVTAPPTFDAFFFEIFEALLLENTMHLIYEAGRLSPNELHKIIKNAEIGVATLLPNIIANLNLKNLPSLYDLTSMGAIPNEKVIEDLIDSNITIRNEYGPTEFTIATTEHVCRRNEPHTSIGKPIRHTQMYIIDDHGNECPVGIEGNLFIAGPGIARGYIENPARSNVKEEDLAIKNNEDPSEQKKVNLTKQKFVKKRFYTDQRSLRDALIPNFTLSDTNMSEVLSSKPYNLFSKIKTSSIGRSFFSHIKSPNLNQETKQNAHESKLFNNTKKHKMTSFSQLQSQSSQDSSNNDDDEISISKISSKSVSKRHKNEPNSQSSQDSTDDMNIDNNVTNTTLLTPPLTSLLRTTSFEPPLMNLNNNSQLSASNSSSNSNSNIGSPSITQPNIVTLYDTGDRAYRAEDGNIIFCGRKDNQIKLFGAVRFDLNTIKEVLNNHPKIKDVEVRLTKNREGFNLFCITKYAQSLSIDEVNNYLSQCTYIPKGAHASDMRLFKNFPLTKNGKVDDNQLVILEEAKIEDNLDSLDVNAVITKIWAETLSITETKIAKEKEKSFIQLGGNSMQQIIIEAKINRHYKLNEHSITFNNPNITLFDMANTVKAAIASLTHNQKSFISNLQVQLPLKDHYHRPPKSAPPFTFLYNNNSNLSGSEQSTPIGNVPPNPSC